MKKKLPSPRGALSKGHVLFARNLDGRGTQDIHESKDNADIHLQTLTQLSHAQHVWNAGLDTTKGILATYRAVDSEASKCPGDEEIVAYRVKDCIQDEYSLQQILLLGHHILTQKMNKG